MKVRRRFQAFATLSLVASALFVANMNDAQAVGSPCLHNDGNNGGDLCVHYLYDLQGSYYAYPLGLNYTTQKFATGSAAGGQGLPVLKNAESADNFATNQNAAVCTGTYGGGICTEIPLNWHANLSAGVLRKNVSQVWL